MKVKVEIDEHQVLSKVTGDKFGLFVANEWRRLITPYTPRDNGTLIRTSKVRPFEIEYIQPYSHYVYEGVLYVDPNTGSPIAEFGAHKIPTGTQLKYQKINPFATDHWDEKAAKAGQLNKLYRSINAALQSGKI